MHDLDQCVIDLHPHDDGNLELLKKVFAASRSHRDPPAPAEVEHIFFGYTHILADEDLPKTAALACERWKFEADLVKFIFAVSLKIATFSTPPGRSPPSLPKPPTNEKAEPGSALRPFSLSPIAPEAPV